MPDCPVHHVHCPSCGDVAAIAAAGAAATVASMREFFVRHGDCGADRPLTARRTA